MPLHCFFCGKAITVFDKAEMVLYEGTYVASHTTCELARKTGSVMRSTIPTIKEKIMAENNETTTSEATAAEVVVKPNRLQSFVNNHPRAAKAAAITGVAATAVVAVVTMKNVRENKQHAINAGDHAKDAVSELAATTSLKDTEA